MNRNERFIEIAKKCSRGEDCLGCPYRSKKDCVGLLLTDAIERLEKQSAPTVMPDCETECRRLNDELCRVNVEYERTQRELHEVRKELAYLRAIKATTEAFLGVKIDG